MVEEFNVKDIDEVMNLWLNTNISTHSYIKEKYWRDNYNDVKNAILDAKLYVYKENNKILGFVGLVEDYIAGIFVKEGMQRKGIGKSLLNECKRRKKLKLKVYQKNENAINFYLKEDFKIENKSIDYDTNEIELFMTWEERR